MQYLKRRSGDYKTIEEEFNYFGAVNPRITSFLIYADFCARMLLKKQVWVLSLSRTVAEEKKLNPHIDILNAPSLHRPCDGATFRLSRSSPMGLSDCRVFCDIFNDHFCIVSGVDRIQIVEKPTRHLKIQFAYVPKYRLGQYGLINGVNLSDHVIEDEE